MNRNRDLPQLPVLEKPPTLSQLVEEFENFLKLWQRHPIAMRLLFVMVFNLLIAPALYASSGDSLTRQSAWTLGLLGLLTLGLSIYLFTVIIQPERF